MVTKCGWRKLSQEFILENIEEIKNHFIKEIDQNEFMSNNEHKVYWKLSYFSFCDHWMCFNFWFWFFAWYSYRITRSAIVLKICGITAAIKKYQ